MRLYGLLIAGILTSANLFAASDPFVGTWIYNAQKSPKPTITYGIKDLGADRYALTGSTGETTEIKADGVSIKSPSGATVSFKKVDDHNWEMVRYDPDKTVRTYTVSADDKTLTLHDVYTIATGAQGETTTTYARRSPGHSIFGEWQSVSMVEKSASEGIKMIIEPFETDGLRFSVPAYKHLAEMKFDGKVYADSGPGDTDSSSTSGKRINPSLLQLEGQRNGKPDDTEEFKVSEDGKTLTIVSRPVKSSAVFTTVWDKE